MNRLELKEAPLGRETGHALDLDIKGLNDQGEFEGYASIYGNVDRGGDIVVAGCFGESLSKRPAGKVKMLLHHDSRRLCGVWTEMVEDSRGLRVKGQLLLSTQDGKETYELMRAGALDAMSIGYRTLVDEIDRTTGVRKIVKADLMEVSIVTFPMNERASISSVKSASERDVAAAIEWLTKAINRHQRHMDGSEATSDASQMKMMDEMKRALALLTGKDADGKEPPKMPMKTVRELEQWLMRDAGLSATQAKALLGGGYKSLKAARDAGGSDDMATLLAIRRLEAAFRG